MNNTTAEEAPYTKTFHLEAKTVFSKKAITEAITFCGDDFHKIEKAYVAGIGNVVSFFDKEGETLGHIMKENLGTIFLKKI